MPLIKRLKPAQLNTERASTNNPGDFLLSHTVSRAVPSAPAGLTSVFGMGTGVTLPTKSPENFFRFQISNLRSEIKEPLVFGLGTLVFVRSRCLTHLREKFKDQSPKS